MNQKKISLLLALTLSLAPVITSPATVTAKAAETAQTAETITDSSAKTIKSQNLRIQKIAQETLHDKYGIDSNVVNIPDEALKAGILRALDKDSDYEITEDDLKNLTSLDCHDMGIKDITGLENCTNLNTLDLNGNNITDLSPLEKINIYEKYLKRQTLTLPVQTCETTLTIKNPITSYNGEAFVPKSISDNGVYDKETNTITWKNLSKDTTDLKINYSDGQDESKFSSSSKNPNYIPLPGIPTGYSCTVNVPVNVTVSENSLVDVSDANLKPILLITLGKSSDHKITVKDMQSLRKLELGGRKIKDISCLKYCDNLTYLDLSSNNITDISSITNLKNLETVNLKSNQITDISGIYSSSNKKAEYYITNQSVVLNQAVCTGNHRIENVVVDSCPAVPTQIFIGGKYDNFDDVIYWNNLKRNTAVSYNYEKTISREEAETLNAPALKYSCKVSQFVKVECRR